MSRWIVVLLSFFLLGAVSFPNTDLDYISVTNDSSFNFGDQDFTVAFWYKDSTHDDQDRIFVKGNQADQWWGIFMETTDDIVWTIDDDITRPEARIADDSFLLDGQWHHIVVDRDTSGQTINFYVDNVSKASGDESAVGSIANANGLSIGYIPTGSSESCDGCFISEFAIWDTLLDSRDRQILYASKKKRIPLQVKPSNLVLYLPLDEGTNNSSISTSSDFYRDLSDNGNHGTGTDANSNSLNVAEEGLSYP